MNQAITLFHIVMILGYTVTSILYFNVKKLNENENTHTYTTITTYRLGIVWTTFGGFLDLFLSCILWFIFDIERPPTFLRDSRHRNTYAVIEVIKQADDDAVRTSVNLDKSLNTSITSEEDSFYSENLNDRIIAQFIEDTESMKDEFISLPNIEQDRGFN